jgi:hypothetical protein
VTQDTGGARGAVGLGYRFTVQADPATRPKKGGSVLLLFLTVEQSKRR